MTSPLSVGIFTYSSRPRGSVVHAASLAEALAALGHDVTLYALCKHGDGFFRRVRCALRLLPAGPAEGSTDDLIRQRIGEFHAGLAALAPRHDIWHAEDCLAANALLAAPSAERPFPIVRTVHHVERFESPYLDDCQRRSIEQADAVFSVSELTRKEVLAEFGRPTELLFNGVDPSRFARRRPEHESWVRGRFGIPASARVLLSVGGVEPRKNSLRALSAVAQALARVPDFYWVIAGGASIWSHDAYRADFEALLSELPAERRARVVRTGQLEEEELTALFQLCHALFCPSVQEGFGLSVLEAMAAGRPVVVSDRPPFTEYLDRHSAILVDPESVDDMTDGLEAVLLENGASARLVAAALERVSRYSWQRSALDHVAQYRAILAENRG
jgi:glycosyltransferase-like protein